MQKSAGSFKSNDEDYYLRENKSSFKCNECGEEFQKPILATVSSDVSVHKYFACPRCLAEVSNVKDQEDVESKETVFPQREVRKAAAKLEQSVKCNHFMGYLKQRPKNTPFPEECLTCSKMIDCLTR